MDTVYSIFGKGGLFSVIREILVEIPFVGYYDDNPSNNEEWIGTIENFKPSKNNSIFIAIAAIRNMSLRENLLKKLLASNSLQLNAISKQTYISPSASLGKGNIFSPFVCIHSNVVIGDGGVFFSNSVIEHDCKIGTNVNMGPGVIVAGNVCVGNNVFIGAGSVLKDGINIGDNTIVGAGSLILQDLPPKVIAYGVPGKVVRANTIYKKYP